MLHLCILSVLTSIAASSVKLPIAPCGKASAGLFSPSSLISADSNFFACPDLHVCNGILSSELQPAALNCDAHGTACEPFLPPRIAALGFLETAAQCICPVS